MSTAYLGFTIAASQNADSIQLFQMLSAFHLLHLQGVLAVSFKDERKCVVGEMVNFSRQWNGDGCFSPAME